MDESDNIKIAIIETEMRAMTAAIALQAKEYERRLEELNHAHTRAEVDRARYITGDLFHSKFDQLQIWRSEMDQWRARIIGIAIGIGIGSGVAGGLITGLLMKLWTKP